VSPPAIEVEGLSKRFRLYREKPSSLKARLISSRTRAEDLWALRDVDVEVAEGETLGLIGHNGSGKTTLLKVIAGILRPTAGVVRTRGRVAALLELGAGFHPELTGRENVYLNASFLGLSRRETQRAYDDIVAFAELEDFMDNQVKFYSSGMLVRLGFAIAVHVDPAILLIDEVLAVGDEAFQRRCIDRVRAFQREGRTIVFVTHALDLVRQICDRAVMLHHGRVHAAGEPDDVVQELRYVMLRQDPNFIPEEGSREVEIDQVALVREDGSTGGPVGVGEDLVIQVDVRPNEPVDDLDVSFAVLDWTNRLAVDGRTSRAGIDLGPLSGKRRVRFRLRSLPLLPGRYWVTVGLESRRTGKLYHVQTQRYMFDVAEGARRDRLDVPVEVGVEEL
jgi:ABC-2 type transport system ATP-binding protein